jgi:MerR family transcriptional regulator, light-induced transcriptional regulator
VAAALNIAALSRRTGVAPDTLRKWEQRYGVLQPSRTTGGQRRYDELDVARVEWLRDRLAEGYRIGEAAELLGGAPDVAGRTTDDLRAEILQAVVDADVGRLSGLLDRAFGLYAVERALAEIVAPVLREIGERWADGRISVGQEHLFSEAVRAQLERLLADARGDVRGMAVLACAPGELHELGLLMLAVLLRADGWQVAYLGADTPATETAALAETLSAALVAISVSMEERLDDLTSLRPPPGSTVVLGGAAASVETASRLGARHLGDDLVAAVRQLRPLGR